MADRNPPSPTGRRVRGYISDLVELTADKALWTAVVYHPDYRDDDVLAASAAAIAEFASKGSDGLPPLRLEAPGVFAFDTGEVRSTRELMGAAHKGVGWKTALQWFVEVCVRLQSITQASGRKQHGSLDPHRVMVDYDGAVHLIGLGLPRLDLLDFIDDATLLPPTEALRFTAPESLEGAEEDAGTDLFVLGLILVKFATGTHVYAESDPTALLAAAAEGEAKDKLAAFPLDTAIKTFCTQLLEPWPEDRFQTLDEAIAAATPLLEATQGDDLAATMTELADIGSDVEVDLKPNWTLPVPPPPLDDAARQRQTHDLRASIDAAVAALAESEAAQTELNAVEVESTKGTEALEEASTHITSAKSALDDARASLDRADKATKHDVLEEATVHGQERADHARGALSEADRALTIARERFEAAESDAREAAERSRVEQAKALSQQITDLHSHFDAIDQRQGNSQALRESAAALVAELTTAADEGVDSTALTAFEERVNTLDSTTHQVEADAEADALARATAIEEADLAAKNKRIADLDKQIEALIELKPTWAKIVKDAKKLDDGRLKQALTQLESDLSTLKNRRGDADADETERLLTELSANLRLGVDNLNELRGELEQADQQRAEAEKARKTTAEAVARLAEEASALSKQVNAIEKALTLTHPHAEPVSAAIDALHNARSDVERANEALSQLEVEPDDDFDAVLDAANTHLGAARTAFALATTASEEASTADAAERERLGAEERARIETLQGHRDQLNALGVRVNDAAQTVRSAAEDAQSLAGPLLSRLDERESVLAEPLRLALEGLLDHLHLLEGRAKNFADMAGPAGEIEDPEDLEGWVHTGMAEADFAEADLRDLPALQTSFDTAAKTASDDQAAFEAERLEAQEALQAIQTRLGALTPTDPPVIPDVLDTSVYADHIKGLTERLTKLRSELAKTMAQTVLPDGPVESGWIEALDALSIELVERTQNYETDIADLGEAIELDVQERAEATARHEAAAKRVAQATSRIETARTAADISLVEIDDEAVRERVEATRAALRLLLDAPPEDLASEDSDPEVIAPELERVADAFEAHQQAVATAHEAYLADVEQTTSLVGVLRNSIQRAEAAVDEASNHSAKARAATEGLFGTWPDLEAEQTAVRHAVGVVDQAAADAVAASEDASSATDSEAASTAAEGAEQAAARAADALNALGPLTEALALNVQAARDARTAADETQRKEAVEQARTHLTQAAELSERLDESSRDAVGLVEESRAEKVRAAWLHAEPIIDGAAETLASIDAHLQGVVNATTADDAHKALSLAVSALESAPDQVEAATTAAAEVVRVARAEVAANEQLVVDLQAYRVELDALVAELEKRHAEIDDSEPLADLRNSMQTNLDHVRAAREEVLAAIESAPEVTDDASRSALLDGGESAVTRARAGANTVQALYGKAVAAREAAQANEARMARDARARLEGLESVSQELHGRLTESGTAALEAHHQQDGLVEECAAIEDVLARANTLMEGSRLRKAEAGDDLDSRMLMHLAKQVEKAHQKLLKLEEPLLQATTALSQQVEIRARKREATLQAHQAKLFEMGVDLAKYLEDGLAPIHNAQTEVEACREKFEDSPATASRNAWLGARDAVAAAVEHVATAKAQLAEFPRVSATDEAGVEAEQEQAVFVREQVEATLAKAHSEVGGVEELLATAFRSSEALAGILVDAGAVRERFAGYEAQVTQQKQRLGEAMKAAPVVRASRAHTTAQTQLAEIEETLVEVRTSLDELGEAGTADEAEALLEVATVSLDIAESVLEYALPAVQTATEAAEAEAEAARAHLVRSTHLHERFDTAKTLPATPDELNARLDAFTARTKDFKDHIVVDEAATEARELLTDVLEAITGLSTEVEIPEDLDAFENLLTETEEQAQLVTTRLDALNVSIERLDASLVVAVADREARAVAIAEATERVTAARTQLSEAQQAGVSQLEELEANPLADEVPLELEVLRQSVEARRALSIADPEEASVEAWEKAANQAEEILTQALEFEVDAGVKTVSTAIRELEQQREERAAALVALQERYRVASDALTSQSTALNAAWETAQVRAENHPLEAGLPLSALEAAQQDAKSVERPELPDDPSEAAPVVQAFEEDVSRIAQLDAEALLGAVDAAVEQALQEEADLATAMESAHHRLQEARRTREKNAAERTERLQGATGLSGRAELQDLWNEVVLTDQKIRDASLPLALPDTLEDAKATVADAEASLTQDHGFEAAWTALQTARADADQRRTSGVETIESVRNTILARLEEARAHGHAASTLPDTPPVQAAMKALLAAQSQLESILPVRIDDTVPLNDVEARAFEATMLAEQVEGPDIAGLRLELDQAVETAREQEAREVEKQQDGIREAIETLVQAHTRLAEELGALEQRLSEAKALGTAFEGDFAQARNTLETARASLVDLDQTRSQMVAASESGDPIQEVALAVAALAFEGEQHTETADAAATETRATLTTVEGRAAAVDDARSKLDELDARIQARVESVQQVIDDAPSPRSPEAEAESQALDSLALDAEATRATAALASNVVREKADATASLEAYERLVEIENELKQLLDHARKRSEAIRAENGSAAEKEAAKKREMLAAERERASLAAERAERAHKVVADLMEQASKKTENAGKDADIQSILGRLADVHQSVLGAVDEARDHARKAETAEHPEGVVARAVAVADRAETEARGVDAILLDIDTRLFEIEAEREAEAQKRDQVVLAKRDAELPAFREALDSAKDELDRLPVPESTQDEALKEAGARFQKAKFATKKVYDSSREALQAFASARSGDIDDFRKDVQRQLEQLRQSQAHLKTALTDFHSESTAAQGRGAELELEEYRGRAWDACRLSASLASDLRRAREALPDVPRPVPPKVREGMDRLAEVERRLWRAGQRADDARERAGTAKELAAVKSAAVAAERAIGKASRWEREIDQALSVLTTLLNVDELSVAMPKNQRMAKLRRGRFIDPGKAPVDKASMPKKDSATEALLNRIRKGKKRGETGRERLKRLRAETKKKEATPAKGAKAKKSMTLEPVSLVPTKDEYPSLQDMEDYQATTVEKAPDADATVVEAPVGIRKKRRVQPTFIPDDIDDAKTQALTINQLRAMRDVDDD